MPVEVVWQGTPAVTLNKNKQDTGNEFLFLVKPSEKGTNMNDPFATEPETTDNVTEFPAPKTEETKPVAQDQDGKIVVTLKGGTGFDSPWIVIHAADAGDALEQLNDKTLGALIARTKEIGTYFAGGNDKPAAQAAPQQQTRANQPQGAAAPFDVSSVPAEDRVCVHGARQPREGVSKQGKPYKALFCSSRDRNNQCPPVWVK